MNTSSSNKPLLGAGLLAAVAASLCCITPLLAVLSGLGGIATAFSWLTPFRPYSVALTIGALGFAWYQKLKPSPTDNCGCSVAANPSFIQSKRFLAGVTVLASLLLAFPYYGGQFYTAPSSTTPIATVRDATPVWKTSSYRIEGMTCEACATHVERAVQQVPGVQSVSVSYEQGTAQVRYNGAQAQASQVEQAINSTGYRVLNPTASR